MAYKPIEIDIQELHKINRSDIESELRLLGLILARNEVKSDTPDTIRALHHGNIKTKIITGDTAFTAFYIAARSGISDGSERCYLAQVEKERIVWRNVYHQDETIDPRTHDISNCILGVSSNSFIELLKQGETDLIVNHVTIYARMKPLDKEAIVKLHQEAGLIVGMCGDGANDCAALKSAHCGIALSDSEASLVAPFSGSSRSAMSTVDTVREGRACLANSFSGFKFTLLYGILQTSQMLIAYTYGTDLSEAMYLFEDFGIYIPLAFLVVRSHAETTLSGSPPTARVFGLTTSISLFGQIMIFLLSMFVCLVLLQGQSWYFPEISAQELASHDEIVVNQFTSLLT